MACFIRFRSFSLRFLVILLCIPFAGMLIIPTSYAQSGPGGDVQQYRVKKVTAPPVIDGLLDDPAWERAVAVSLDHERFPDPNAEPPVETRFYITYDNQNLYVAFKASDPDPEVIRAHLMDRDQRQQLSRDDHVGFTIDPFNNGQWGFRFRVNPLGVQADAVYSDESGRSSYSWDAIWESEGTITEEGYRVEIRVPLSSINVPAVERQTWRFQAFRNYPRNVRHRFLSRQVDLDNRSSMAQFDRLQGFENLSSGLNLEVNPVLTAKRSDRTGQGEAAGLQRGPVTLNPGGYLRWGIKPNVNLSATVNPDFSQIEADALRLRENERFVLSFPEKRPFFLESSEIFDTPFNAVFTRSVVDPDAGIKFTGKSGSHSYGTFVTRDRSNRMLFPSNQGSQQQVLDRPSYSEIFRYRNRISDRASVGLLAEGRQAEDASYHNYVGGVDGNLQFLDSNNLQFQYLRSSTDYTESIADTYGQPADAFGGDALMVQLNHSSANWQGHAMYGSISGDFRNDNGFFPRADIRQYVGRVNRIFRGNSDSWYSSISVGPALQVSTDLSGTVTDQSYSLSASVNGPLQSYVFTELNQSMQRFGGEVFDGMQAGVLFFRLQPGSFLTRFRFYSAYGEEVDFTNVRMGRQLVLHPGLTFDFGRSLNLELDPNFQRFIRQGRTIFTTYLLGTKLIYHFNRRTFLRAQTQYRYVDRNPSRYNNPGEVASSDESFFYQLLFSYKINPQSKLFLGYSSGYGAAENRPLSIRSRTGFLKAGYAWVF